jgi:hypothetical protein
MLFNFGIAQTLLDCTEVLSKELQREYLCIVQPTCLSTIDEYVFPPTDRLKLEGLLKSMVSNFSKLYVYASIFDKAQIDQVLHRYKQLFSKTTQGTERPHFQLDMVESFQQNLNLQKLKRICVDKNQYDLSIMLL